MKKYLILSIILLLFSCDKKSKVEKAVEKIPIKMKLHRFEQAFFNANPNNLSKVKTEYPDFFPPGIHDSVWTNKIKNPQWRELYAEVEKKYKNFTTQQQEIENLFQHIKYYFPSIITPQIYTAIGDMNDQYKTIYAKDKLIIALELYLGKDHRFYSEFPEYLRLNFQERQILPDIVTSFSQGIQPVSRENDLLSLMINSGKELYLKDLLLPEYTDAEKIGYTDAQIKWCTENESYMWEYFINDKLLYSSDSKLPNRFINLAPFSKFYLEIDNESPGRVGQWIGWQMVRSFIQNNPKVTIQEILKMDSKTIFEQSRYKPKK